MEGEGLTLWQGTRLRIRTGDIADWVASKLIRYDDLDRSDVQYLLATSRIPLAEVERAARRLPIPFVGDPRRGGTVYPRRFGELQPPSRVGTD